MRAFSSILFVPGSRPDRFAKAVASDADLIVIDLEDAVAEEDKAGARAAALAYISAATDAERARLALRCNGIATTHGLADLQAIGSAPSPPKIMFVPMVDDAGDIATIIASLGDARPALVPLIETPAAVAAAYAIAAAPGVAGIMLGGADLCAALGVPMGWDALAHARGTLVLASAAANVAAIDVPSIQLDEPGLLEEETRRVRAMGFSAKAAIHPVQVATINAIMRPTAEQLAEAQQALSAYEEGGRRAVRFRGRMLEAPIIKQYQAVLAKVGMTSHAG